MKTLILISLFLFTSQAHAAEVLPGPLRAHVISVYDGDTFTACAQTWLGQMTCTKIRINGIDTPERRTKCKSEKTLAIAATTRLEQLLNSGVVELSNIRYGKWAGRVLATVVVDGANVSDTLIGEGIARPYDGGKREPWCE